MSTYSAVHTLEIQSEAIPMVNGRPVLAPVRLSGHDGLNGLFEYELLLKTPDGLNIGASEAADFDLDGFIGREISCRIQLDGAGLFLPGGTGAAADHVGAGVREINALITEAEFWGEEGRFSQYRLVLKPWLYLATRNTDCRIFQNQTVLQTLDALLARYPFPVDKRLIENYPLRDYQTQFNETDFEFFSRLTAENGISYFFESRGGHHRLVLIDNMGAYQRMPSAAYQQVDYHPPGWRTDAEYIHSFVPHHRLTSGRYSSRDYDYTRPRADLSVSRAEPCPTGQADGEVYQWHDGLAGSHYAQPRAGTAEANDPQAEGRDFALLRMQALRTHGARARASGNLRGIVPGCSFELKLHPRQKANAEYLVLDTRFLIEDTDQASQVKEASPGRRQQWRVEVDFTAHPMREPLRPALTFPKPYSPGAQTALVVGPDGENLWTDQLGRIKVQFPWDRIGMKNQHSSCWVRVSSEWAGNQLGAMHLPRIGQEVLISFIGGDPDLPVCTGRLYNQNNLPPWALPAQSALSGLRSRELASQGGNSAAGRSNHLVLDDTAEKLQVQLKSDHQCSSVSLGHIARIEDNAGRKEPRGEGVEVRTDGHVAVRAQKGLLLTTDGRSEAVGGMLSRNELVACLEKALAIAKDLDRTAGQCQAGARETAPQQHLSEAVVALGHGANDEPLASGTVPGGQPVLALSGAAGIASATPRDHTQYAGLNIDTIAGHNQQHYADLSILQAAGQDIEQFAHRGDIRAIASKGKIIQQAQHNSAELTAQKSVTVTSTEEHVILRGKKSILLVLEDGTYLRLADGKLVAGMQGEFTVKSAGRQFEGPATLATDLPEFNRTDLAQKLKLHNGADRQLHAPQRAYQIVKGEGAPVVDKTGADAAAVMKPYEPFDIGF
ncbi:type VI secretion protein ImpA [Rhodoferax koreense]|uniref:Type VI secretion protein ImpA n=1 Tax=Rhodoferax koreensis TaxID=1842727 RepID=A0A1P8JQ15_9BURK|nr:type VI secretion system Vgr family protein [Rhodoferax koreense]APW35846.1 type VI secretion protein ImpA [Rhodoferax koreense]